MNIQIFGTLKDFDTQKAERYFKERGIKVQSVNIKEKGPSRGELESICRAIGSLDPLINTKSKSFSSIAYLQDEDKFDKLLEQPELLNTPLVRNGKEATVGFCPEKWKLWFHDSV
jgi:arsenate reductase (glutaredoxin)